MFFTRKKKDHPVDKLAALAKKGDIQAFGEIYDHFVESVFRLVYFKTGDRELAEDLTQNVFLKVIENIRSFREKGSFSSWLFAIARNLIIDHYRSKRKHISIESVPESELITVDNTQELEYRELFASFVEALNGLSKDARELIISHSMEGYSFDEIAKTTGKSVVALRSTKHRALKKLSKIMSSRR
ncbi:MAG: hypothetical protein A2126_01395 [Candidatus Woykebacteria bacterium GWB1_45_5]|uniref:RNA polymerase sigma factor n=1 Tax=Candidatus Woykebacteria bacterium GWB1_45_5 TaxID=1802592 RepID=A0A1G1W7S8_9BACT|nr:MAG: hypothetical protein A2126_01395 [Candidatus Woykebacteria bacterium GWB1_45_5]